MKKLMTKVLMMGLVISSVLMPMKKADAGVVLIGGGSPIVGVLAIAGGAGLSGLSFMSYMFCGFAGNSKEVAACATVSGLGFFSGIGLIVLDEEGSEKKFDTIPAYLLDEVKSQAIAKGESMAMNSDGMKVVQFSDSEVDELFLMADEFTSNEELAALRSVLTSPTAH
jgi:hypothetical protein